MTTRPRSGRPLRRGFSLIEVMVVVSIITLLVSLSLPSLRMSKESGYAIKCETNLRQIMLACTSYTGDNLEHMPFPNWGGYGQDLGGTWKIGGWLYHNKANLDWNTDAQWNDSVIRSGLIFGYTNKEPLLYRCVKQLRPYPMLSGQITSYNMNGSVCGYGSNITFRLEKWRATDFLLWEVDPDVIQEGWWWDGANHPLEGISSNRHLQGGTLVAADCHVEWMQYREYDAEAMLPARNRLWNAPDSWNGR